MLDKLKLKRQPKPASTGGPVASKTKLYAKPTARLAVVAILVLAGGIGYYYHHSHPSLTPAQRLKKYSSSSYSKLDQFKLPGAKAGEGISFNKPLEFTPIGDYGPTAALAELAVPYKNSKTIFVGNIVVASVDAGAYPPTPELLQTLGETITAPVVKNKPFLVPQVHNFVKDRLPGYDVFFFQMIKLPTTNLKAFAWYGKFTATPTTNKQKLNPLKGYVFFAAGKSTYYYFYVLANQDNWQANQTTWAKVINSIRIDQ